MNAIIKVFRYSLIIIMVTQCQWSLMAWNGRDWARIENNKVLIQNNTGHAMYINILKKDETTDEQLIRSGEIGTFKMSMMPNEIETVIVKFRYNEDCFLEDIYKLKKEMELKMFLDSVMNKPCIHNATIKEFRIRSEHTYFFESLLQMTNDMKGIKGGEKLKKLIDTMAMMDQGSPEFKCLYSSIGLRLYMMEINDVLHINRLDSSIKYLFGKKSFIEKFTTQAMFSKFFHWNLEFGQYTSDMEIRKYKGRDMHYVPKSEHLPFDIFLTKTSKYKPAGLIGFRSFGITNSKITYLSDSSSLLNTAFGFGKGISITTIDYKFGCFRPFIHNRNSIKYTAYISCGMQACFSNFYTLHFLNRQLEDFKATRIMKFYSINLTYDLGIMFFWHQFAFKLGISRTSFPLNISYKSNHLIYRSDAARWLTISIPLQQRTMVIYDRLSPLCYR